jgi:hypothetical protein
MRSIAVYEPSFEILDLNVNTFSLVFEFKVLSYDSEISSYIIILVILHIFVHHIRVPDILLLYIQLRLNSCRLNRRSKARTGSPTLTHKNVTLLNLNFQAAEDRTM